MDELTLAYDGFLHDWVDNTIVEFFDIDAGSGVNFTLFKFRWNCDSQRL